MIGERVDHSRVLERLRRGSDSGLDTPAGAASRVGDLVAEQASRTFAGRKQELSLLLQTLSDSGPAVVYLHGIAGIGKSRVLSAFAERAQARDATVIVLDCRAVEPTEHGFLRALGSRFGKRFGSVEDVARSLGKMGSRVVLALDHWWSRCFSQESATPRKRTRSSKSLAKAA